MSDTVLEFATEGDHETGMVTATPAHVVTAPGINNPRCAVTLTGGDSVGVVPTKLNNTGM